GGGSPGFGGSAGGRSRMIAWVATGMATMNTISSTSMMSTNGVTLMSAFWPRPYLDPPAPDNLIAMGVSLRENHKCGTIKNHRCKFPDFWARLAPRQAPR